MAVWLEDRGSSGAGTWFVVPNSTNGIFPRHFLEAVCICSSLDEEKLVPHPTRKRTGRNATSQSNDRSAAFRGKEAENLSSSTKAAPFKGKICMQRALTMVLSSNGASGLQLGLLEAELCLTI